MLTAALHFANHYGYRVCMLWGVIRGVCYCRFEELFSPVSGIRVVSITPDCLAEIESRVKKDSVRKFGEQGIPPFRNHELPKGDLFSWDLAGCGH